MRDDLHIYRHSTKSLLLNSFSFCKVTPAGGLGKKWKVNLFPVPSSESFRMARFAPTRGNIHPKLYLEEYVEGKVICITVAVHFQHPVSYLSVAAIIISTLWIAN